MRNAQEKRRPPSAAVAAISIMLGAAAAAAQNNPVPLLNQPLVPDAVAPGSASFTLTVNGTGFVSGSMVNWNGVALGTTFVSTAQLTAIVPAANIAASGTASVSVSSPGLGLQLSNSCTLQVTSPENSVNLTQAGEYISVAPEYVVSADFNGDGLPDLAISNRDYERIGGNVLIMAGTGKGYFRPLATTPLNLSGALVAGDLNGDGKQDLAIFTNNGPRHALSVLLGNGDGTFQGAAGLANPLSGTALAMADVNGDGKVDVVAALGGGVAVMLGDGNGGLVTKATYGPDTGAGAVAIGDFNQDGNLDLAFTGDTYLDVRFGAGDGTFQSLAQYKTGSDPCSVAAADFNEDGLLDLAVGNCGDGTVSILIGNGDGSFQPARSFAAAVQPAAIVPGDFNGDGKLDLAVESNSPNASNGVYLLLGNGDATFQSPTAYFAGGGVAGIAVGDFNADGRLDLAILENDMSVFTSLVQTAPR